MSGYQCTALEVTAAAYEENLQANIEALAERLKLKRYRAKLVRRTYIAKENGKERPLGGFQCLRTNWFRGPVRSC